MEFVQPDDEDYSAKPWLILIQFSYVLSIFYISILMARTGEDYIMYRYIEFFLKYPSLTQGKVRRNCMAASFNR